MSYAVTSTVRGVPAVCGLVGCVAHAKWAIAAGRAVKLPEVRGECGASLSVTVRCWSVLVARKAVELTAPTPLVQVTLAVAGSPFAELSTLALTTPRPVAWV